MKALTLTQPWATLVAAGVKNFETRSWSTGHRGPLAIHAAKGLGPVGGKSGLHELSGTEPFRRILTAIGQSDPAELPLGTVLCTTTLIDCRPVEDLEGDGLFFAGGAPYEREFGNYDPGRFAFRLGSRTMVRTGPVRGSLGLWTWDGADS